MTNEETLLTKSVRSRLEAAGCHCIKLSDRFTRGVPDMLVVSDRIVMVEFKVFVGERNVHSYSELGLSGAQDHHLKSMLKRARRSACCVTGSANGGSLNLWVPLSAKDEANPTYRVAAVDVGVIPWILGDLRATT